MSWITGLADKAENILNKLDQNAATALQTPPNSSNTITTTSSLPTIINPNIIQNDRIEVINRIYPANSLQLVKSPLSPKRTPSTPTKSSPTKQVASSVDTIDFPQDISNLSSRRSSLSSQPDSVTIDMSVTSEKNNVPTQPKSISEIQELAAFKIALADISNERDELKGKLLALTDSSQNALMQTRLGEMEILVNRLTAERDQIQNELYDAQSTNKGYMHSISQLESNIAKIQQEFVDVTKKLQMQIKETEQQRLDLVEYRKKAQLALQMKDQMINELKSQGNGGDIKQSSSENSNERVLLLEISTLKEENKQFQEEIQNIRMQLENSKANLHSICRQHEETLSILHTNDDTLRKDIRSEKERILQLESELRVLNQELLATRKQMASQMETYSATIQEKEKQLERVKASYAAAQADPTAFETRIRALTQTLVEKQNSVETMTAERNALKFQLEKAENQLRLSAFNTSTERNPLTLVNHTDDVKAQFPILMRENPFDNRVARRVKRAYSTLDSAGIRLGAFLRRYPLMRIAVLMYVGLLHLWVMFVLLSSTPT
ncbi:golgin-84 [Episyrphus balteatus]|uniref:golgin-84 n=1 Tax=Episyrphus balteatus TaxID=286459 RepID=UPI002486C399|nr:golgin-84 [Episyrphus balteatus]